MFRERVSVSGIVALTVLTHPDGAPFQPIPVHSCALGRVPVLSRAL